MSENPQGAFVSEDPPNDEQAEEVQEDSRTEGSPSSPETEEATASRELETPETAAAPPTAALREETPLETPEDPATPPEATREEVVFGIVQPGGPGGAGKTTYVASNYAKDAPSLVELDTGVGSAPYDRPSVFTPTSVVTLSPTNDAGVGTPVATRPGHRDKQQSRTVYVNPGAF